MKDHILVLTNLPNQEVAVHLAEVLVTQQLAACVNILAPCTSIYYWQGKCETAQEVPMLIKTTRNRYAEVERTIRTHHPYELPEIIYVTLEGGLPVYLEWVSKQTSS